MVSQLIIGSDAEHIRIDVKGRSHPAATDGGADWLDVAIEIAFPPWGGSWNDSLPGSAFARFRKELEAVHRRGSLIAVFRPMEPVLELQLNADPLGHIVVKASAQAGGFGRLFGSVVLQLNLDSWIDQSYLPGLISQLRQIEAEFPVPGDAYH